MGKGAALLDKNIVSWLGAQTPPHFQFSDSGKDFVKPVLYFQFLGHIWFISLNSAVLYSDADTGAQNPIPYPRSNIITSIEFDWSTHKRGAQGSDNFQLTWSDDDHQYGAWGDGNGFRNELRSSLGVSRIEGEGRDWRGEDVWRGPKDDKTQFNEFAGKSWGMISIQGILYMWMVPDVPKGKNARDHFAYVELLRSINKGQDWEKAGWRFENNERLSIPTFLNFGKDNDGARDEYVYSYFIDPLGQSQPEDGLTYHKPGLIYLSRVHQNDLWTGGKFAFQWYAGNPGGGDVATWRTIREKQPVFMDAGGVGWCMAVSYNKGLKRYILTTEHAETEKGVMGIFEAENPWGPWNTIKYWSRENYFGKSRPGGTLPWANNVFFFSFPPKWRSADGKSFTINFTGGGRGATNDSFNTLSGRFIESP